MYFLNSTDRNMWFKPSENSILFQDANLKTLKIISTQDSKDIQPDT